MPAVVKIKLGEPVDEFMRRYGSSAQLNSKNKGSDFVMINWQDPESGTVVIENGYSSLKLTTVLLISGEADARFPAEGLSNFGISLGLPPRNRIMHDDARKKFFQILGDIQRAGWKRWIEPGMPRLSGRDAFKYQTTENSLMSLDPREMLDLEDWMKLEDLSEWDFYKDNEFLTVSLSRDSERMDPKLPGAYFISVELDNEANQQRLAVGSEQRKEWKTLYPQLREKRAKKRATEETKLAEQGYKIDIAYRNPDE